MNITWFGQSCFQITTNQAKNNPVSIVIDPFSPEIGLKVPKLKADILLVTHSHYDHNNVKAVSNNPVLIDSPGEYEIKGVYIQGIPSFHDTVQGKERGLNTIYTLEAEGIRICHLGDLGQNELTTEQLERIGENDILMIPVGGTYTIDLKAITKVLSQIEPKIIIPMHYQIPGLKIKLDGVDKFLKTMGVKSIDPLPKLSIKNKDISAEEAKIIILKH